MARSKIAKVKASQNKKFTVISIVKEQHMYGVAELKTVEFIFFKNEEGCLHRSKAVLHLDKALPHDFDITNEVEGLDFAFLCVLSGSWLYIVSILTSINLFDNSPFRHCCEGHRLLIDTHSATWQAEGHELR